MIPRPLLPRFYFPTSNTTFAVFPWPLRNDTNDIISKMQKTLRNPFDVSTENKSRKGSSPLNVHPYYRNDSNHQAPPAFRNKPRQESKIKGPISKLRKLSSSNTEKSFNDGCSHIDKESDDKEVIEFEEDDEENPFNWSKRRKWVITITVCFISILTGLPAGAYGAGSTAMSKEFHVSQSPFPNLYWATTSWNMGAALFPLFIVPLTESTGRMIGYFASYIMFLAWLFGQAFAPSFATMVVVRFFGGGASSVVINCAGGTVTDIWETAGERSFPMSLYGMTGVVGIALGPFIGGAIQRNLDWRWYVYDPSKAAVFVYQTHRVVGFITFKLLLMGGSYLSSGFSLRKREVTLSSRNEPKKCEKRKVETPGLNQNSAATLLRNRSKHPSPGQ